jgi:hypothetical protein
MREVSLESNVLVMRIYQRDDDYEDRELFCLYLGKYMGTASNHRLQ